MRAASLRPSLLLFLFSSLLAASTLCPLVPPLSFLSPSICAYALQVDCSSRGGGGSQRHSLAPSFPSSSAPAFPAAASASRLLAAAPPCGSPASASFARPPAGQRAAFLSARPLPSAHFFAPFRARHAKPAASQRLGGSAIAFSCAAHASLLSVSAAPVSPRPSAVAASAASASARQIEEAANAAQSREAGTSSAPAFRVGHGWDLHRVSTDPRRVTGPLIVGGVCVSTPPAKRSLLTRALSLLPAKLRALGSHLGLLRERVSCRAAGTEGRLGGTLASEAPPPVENAFGVVAHSDGDVLLHAVCDALFGALSLGDIGEHFPDTDPRYRGVSSSGLVKEALAKVRAAGGGGGGAWEVGSADATLVFEGFKLGPARKRAMQANLAALLEVPPTAVSLKAKTSEGVGPVGRQEAIACHVVLTLVRQASGGAGGSREEQNSKKQEAGDAADGRAAAREL
ncbi:hypothetical protein BESB_076700 [Besnoitia besnoiti]|uniref:2-C-methyl-D-erythritol 2,4-cyclodiphosphate synthase n=1 Tax=Besnoitia besnoiti TaxID=94643 RepID=A0A2A9MCR1_BESBE|nr:hypothetical protein BESB_076700 [Besnoitia besnoiti]PFH33453.1 hypothetical protein BESB_076700 [Besnoitia besnoiti]